jgi:hypothetical protein
MEKIIISFMKGRGKKTLAMTISKNVSRRPHHHLNTFLMGIFLFTFLRLLKNAPAFGRQADAS